jgi:hypothetical protein
MISTKLSAVFAIVVSCAILGVVLIFLGLLVISLGLVPEGENL